MLSFLDDVCKNLLDLDGWKCWLKSVYTADFAKQETNIQEVIDGILELELNKVLEQVAKLLHITLAIYVTSASYEKLLPSVLLEVFLKWRKTD